MRRLNSLLRNRGGAVALLFAIMAIPVIALAGLAVDYGMWNQTYASLNLAADSAALNAARTAAAAFLANDGAYAAEGSTAGAQWFKARLSQQTYASTSANITASVSIAVTNSAVTATVSFSGTVPSLFGHIFNISSYGIGGQAVAAIPTAPYTEIVLMLDNSSSMDIAATTLGINQLMTLSACDPSNAFYDPNGQTSDRTQWVNASLTRYDVYQQSAGGTSFDGSSAAGIALSPVVADPVPTTPFPAAATNEYPTGTFAGGNGATTFKITPPFGSYPTSSATGQTCQGVLPKQSDGNYPIPGPPCAFACHWTNTASTDMRGGTADLFGLARRNNIQLRFDLVKNATNAVISQMSTDNVSAINNLSVGVYTFNSAVSQVYPSNCSAQTPGCEAGSNFTGAEAAVGAPPSYPAVADTGIQPDLGGLTGNNDDTAFPEAMSTLAGSYLTKSGDGTSASTPKKVLILVTDGFQDDPYKSGTANERRAFDPSSCAQVKSMGYTVYVVFTPYYPVVHVAYLTNGWAAIVQGTGPTSITANLQACASAPADYIAATDQASLNNALLAFLKAALTAPARFTK